MPLGPCTACGEDSDEFGDHAIGCGKDGGSSDTMSLGMSSTRLLSRLLLSNRVAVSLPTYQGPRTSLRIFSFLWANGREAALDVTVVSSLQTGMVKRAAAEAGSAASRRHQDKMTKHFQNCGREGIQFYPVVVKALGGWHEDAAALITRVVRQLASHTGKEVDEQIKHLF